MIFSFFSSSLFFSFFFFRDRLCNFRKRYFLNTRFLKNFCGSVRKSKRDRFFILV
ncbi:hypothetical protein LEP1GSC029_0530 [Leptospira interrogans str. 2002000626]|uniref:Uncharacterized protein n=1 Tax=Leptospira interrogans str. 2002000626 TaxID=996803 RepID=A0A829DDB0_LEPIR|nr:hypothetical protein LEP1GSC029_0530 [Leptospira interrogans str. 2002000626]